MSKPKKEIISKKDTPKVNTENNLNKNLKSSNASIIDLSIKELQEKLSNNELSIEEIIEAYTSRIEVKDKQINAFITRLSKKDILEKFSQNQDQIQSESLNQNQVQKQEKHQKSLPQKKQSNSKENSHGKLYGVPFSLKEAYMTKGIQTTASSNVLKNFIAPYNATVYQRILDEGGILVGKTNADAWGHGSSTENSDFTPTKNPWNIDFVPGGSSGGSGASVASKMSLFDLGEDTGGSSRLPANFCGLVGLKPTYGLVPRYGVIELASSLDTVAPIARNIEDLAIVLEVIAGHDEKDSTSLNINIPSYTKELHKPLKKNLVLGLPKEYFDKKVLDKEVLEDLEKAIKTLESIGIQFKEVSLPHSKYAIAVYYVIMTSETSSNLGRYDGIRFGQNRDSFGAEAKRRIMLGTYSLSSGFADEYYHKAAKVRRLIKEDFDRAFKKVDAIFAPVSPTPPFKFGEKAQNPLQMYLSDVLTVPVNLAGIPSLAVPTGGFSVKDKLPLGFQLIGDKLSESLLLQIGYNYEHTVGGFKLPN